MLTNTSGSIPRQVAAAGGSDPIAIDLKARTWQSEMHYDTMISAESNPGLAVSDSRVFLGLVDDGCSGCNGHGACEAGHCVCDPHWSGNDCSENVGFAASG